MMVGDGSLTQIHGPKLRTSPGVTAARSSHAQLASARPAWRPALHHGGGKAMPREGGPRSNPRLRCSDELRLARYQQTRLVHLSGGAMTARGTGEVKRKGEDKVGEGSGVVENG